MAHDSAAPPTAPRFPVTNRSAVLSLAEADPARRARALATVVRVYFRPAYEHVRSRWHKTGDLARDLVQSFFLEALEHRQLATYDPARGHFRTFFRVCLDRFVQHAERHARAQKRGGDRLTLALDFEGAEAALVATTDVDPEQRFDRAFVRGVLDLALAELEARCRARDRVRDWEIFARVALEPDSASRPSYADLARELGVSTTFVTNRLARARRDFRQIALGVLRELTASDDEFRHEARAVLGVEVPT